MVMCLDCEQEMTTARGCTVGRVRIGPRTVARARFRDCCGQRGGRCHDCGAMPGGFHHLGCDCERCPLCRGQLITCGCGDPIDEDDDTPRVIPVLP
jgi:hypothetical protein